MSGTNYTRTNSQICPSPADDLFDAITKNKQDKIKRIITANPSLLHYYYPIKNKTPLLIACSEKDSNSETVETLLHLGADPRETNNDNGWEALHYAAIKTDYETLNLLLRHSSEKIINVTVKEGNALHILIRYGATTSEEFHKCMKLLIENGINVNCGDSNNRSPIIWAIRLKQMETINLILNQCFDIIDLDNYKFIDKTARQVLTEWNNIGLNLPPSKTSVQSPKQFLFNCLKEKREDDFIQYDIHVLKAFANSEDYESTMLQICCEKNLRRAALHLLENGEADPNAVGTTNHTTPIEIAANSGYSEIFKALLQNGGKYSNQTLCSILRYIDDPFMDNMGCYNALMEIYKKKEPDSVAMLLNQKDDRGNTPLHYAVRYADADIIKDLLQLGASLGTKNDFDFMPIENIEPEVLRQHLDQCVKFDMKSKKYDKQDFQVTFDYRSLIPPYLESFDVEEKVNDSEQQDDKTYPMTKYHIDPEKNYRKKYVAETEIIYFMSKASEFKHLLKHPVIESFLFVKWLHIQWLFWTNLVFYSIFVTSLLAYIFMGYAFIPTVDHGTFYNFIVKLSHGLLIISVILLILRELFQILITPNEYFRNFENYIEITLIIIILMILSKETPPPKIRKELSSIAILLAAFEFILMLGQHPYFSTNVVMLRTVSLNFFKFLLWYSGFIIAFALSFYLLFASEKTTTAATNKDDNDDESFNDPGKSIFKTIIMLTGEFDAGNINFDSFPFTSELIFVLFIFVIAIILVNLLNGLAVSDTQTIKNDAKLVGLISRAQLIRHVENMLLGNLIPTRILRALNNWCCYPISTDCHYSANKILAKKVCLFPSYLNYELIMYPNQRGLIESPSSHCKRKNRSTSSCIPCAATYLNRNSWRETQNIIQMRCQAKSKDDLEILKNGFEILKLDIIKILQILQKVDVK